ncbi:MAG: NACHT domain-containing protein, partial [Cyanobacteria bacterium J083]
MSFEDTIFPEVVDIWDLERLYKDLAQVKHIGTEKVTPLTPVEKAILRGLLAGNPPKQIAAQLHWTPGSMSVELSNGLYRYVETLTNRDIKTLKNWRDVAKWLEEAKYKKSKIIQDWEETPDISHFYGREAELAQLKQAILVEKNRLILLLGMGGIGKTVLAAKLAQTIHNNFEYTIWRNLRYAPPLAELLTDLLTSFNPQIEIPASINSKISRLIEYLRQNKCLLILDGLEGILCHDNLAGFYQEKYRNYSQLIKRIAEESHQSCLILTSQDEPADLLLIQTQKFTSLQLGGLGEAARQILQEKELSDTKYWRELVERYHGNPLAIKLVAATIKDLFGGSVDSFLSQGTEFGVI